MKIVHWVGDSPNGLCNTVRELAMYEEKLGNEVSLRDPGNMQTWYGFDDDNFDIHAIHHQIYPFYNHDRKPKILFFHGNPEYVVRLHGSAQTLMDLMDLADACLVYIPEQEPLWNQFHRMHAIPKGIDLETFKPIKVEKKFPGEPAILYAENWLSGQNPLVVFAALETVWQSYPDMKFYPMGCTKKSLDLWMQIIRRNKYYHFTPKIFEFQPVEYEPGELFKSSMVKYYNMADIVISPTFPSYGRVSMEALACNKPVITYHCNPHGTYKALFYDPKDMADQIIDCIIEKPEGMRQYAEEHFDLYKSAQETINLYQRFL
jgi:glycosyltransferase involved in cell wall biosynthesis